MSSLEFVNIVLAAIMFLGTGLGKAQQGRVEPVGLSSQKGRRGLGHIIEVKEIFMDNRPVRMKS